MLLGAAVGVDTHADMGVRVGLDWAGRRLRVLAIPNDQAWSAGVKGIRVAEVVGLTSSVAGALRSKSLDDGVLR